MALVPLRPAATSSDVMQAHRDNTERAGICYAQYYGLVKEIRAREQVLGDGK